MKSPRIISLDNGTTLYVTEDQVTYEPSGDTDRFTVSMQRVVMKLAENLNCYVPYGELHQVYDGRAMEDIGRNLQRMKDKMPPAVKGAIQTKNGLGYRLVGTPVEAPQDTAGNGPALLTGDYYDFFLDPVGSGAVLGGYLRIEDLGDPGATELPVSGVLGIRSDSILFSDALSGIFAEDPANRYARFRDFHAQCSPNDRRCFWSEGSVGLVKDAAELTLSTRKGAKWTVVIELGNYLSGGRGRNRSEDGKYRGGKGIVMALSTQYGTFAGKFGIIRTSFCKSQISLKNPDLQQMLKITDRCPQIPLMVPSIEDNFWYNWFMSQ